MIRAIAPYIRDPSQSRDRPTGQDAQENRYIINISSTSGLHGNIGQINYATGKLGIVGLTKTVAKEWGPLGIRCNAVAFGFIDTRLTRSKENRESIKIGSAMWRWALEEIRSDASTRSPLGRPGSARRSRPRRHHRDRIPRWRRISPDARWK